MQKNQLMPALKAGNTEKKRGDLPMGQEYLPSDTPQQRLQDLMKEYKITQAELASKIGVAESSISRFLNGTKNKDRKSTRLNSSHVSISYAVFCLKKKNKRIKEKF